MLERLDYVKLEPRRILDAGCGPSTHTEPLSRRYPGSPLVGLDFSLGMLRQSPSRSLMARMTGRSRRSLVCADFERLPLASRSVSLAWSNMALHWSADIQATLMEFHRVLEVEGLLMFSTLGPDTLKELRSAFSKSDEALPHVHAFIDMHDLGDMLVAAGFAAPVMDTETITLTYADIASMVKDLRGSGQTCALASRSRGLMAPARWARVRHAIQGGAREGRLPVTAEVVYGHAWKAAPRRTPEGHAIVKLATDSRSRK